MVDDRVREKLALGDVLRPRCTTGATPRRPRVRAALGGGGVRPARRSRVAGRGGRPAREPRDPGGPGGALVMTNVITEAHWKGPLAADRVRRDHDLPRRLPRPPRAVGSVAAVRHGRPPARDARGPRRSRRGPWPVVDPLGARTLQGPVRMQSFRGGVELSAAFAAGPYHYTSCGGFTTTAGCVRGSRSTAPASTTSTPIIRTGGSTFDLDGARHDAFERSRPRAGTGSSAKAGFRTAARPTSTATCGARSTPARAR